MDSIPNNDVTIENEFKDEDEEVEEQQQQLFQLHQDLVNEDTSHLSNDTPLDQGLPFSGRRRKSDPLHQGLEYTAGPGTDALLAQDSTSSFDVGRSLERWFYESAWPGMGLFGESYMLFSIGTLKPIWEVLFPDCFGFENCSPRLLNSLTYSVVIGIIVGMIVIGDMASSIGRRQGSILTASLMSGGALGMFLVSIVLVNSPVWLYRCLSALLFVFGFGVGGEYPLAASISSEQAMQNMLKRQQHMQQGQGENEQTPPDSNLAGLRSSDVLGKPNSESSFSDNNKKDTEQRGRKVQLVFTMQGMGIWFNSLTLMFLLIVTGQVGQHDNYDHGALLTIWRISYLIGAFILLSVLATRYLYLKESKVWVDDKRRREENQNQRERIIQQFSSYRVDGANNTHISSKNLPPAIETNCSSISSLSNPTMIELDYDERILKPVPSTEPEDDLKSSPTYLLIRNFGVRLFGASMSWLLWDISFYGNKLFQSSFLLALTGEDTSLFQFMVAATLNATVSLLGYFAAAKLVDHPDVGRLRLQSVGFLITGTLFIICGFSFDQLSSGWLVALYLASGFFGQLGPNATTFLIPAEIFPTEMRTLCHGICAASGKVGALIAAVLFNFLDRDVDLFLLSGYASFIACIITVWTIPETNGLDLLEIDRKWRMILEGQKRDYTGPANHPDNLSMYERFKLGLQF